MREREELCMKSRVRIEGHVSVNVLGCKETQALSLVNVNRLQEPLHLRTHLHLNFG